MHANDTLLAYQYHKKADASAFSNIDTCLEYTLKAIPLLKKIEDWNKYQYNLNCLSHCYQHKEQYAKLLSNNLFALEEARKYLEPDDLQYRSALNNLGYAYRLHSDYDSAVDLYNRSILNVKDTVSNYNLIGTTFQNIGVTLLEKGDYLLALNYLKQSKNYLTAYSKSNKQIKPNSFLRLAKVSQFIAKAYKKQKQYNDAAVSIENSISIINSKGKAPDSYYVFINLELIDLYLLTNEIHKARPIIKNIMGIQSLTPRQQVLLDFKIAKLNAHEKEFENARAVIEKCIERKEEVSIIENVELYKLYNLILLELGDFDFAFDKLNESTFLLEDLKSGYLNYDTYSLNSAFVKKALNHSGVDKLDKSRLLKCLENNLNYSKNVLRELRTEEAKLEFLSANKEFNEQVLKYLFESYQNDSQKSILNLAFEYIENSKALLLQNDILKHKFTQESSSNLFRLDKKKKAKLNQFIAQYNKAVEKGMNKLPNFQVELNDRKIKNLSDSVFQYRRQLSILEDKISREHPEKYKMLFGESVALDKIKLNHGDLMINYFCGQKSIYAIALKENEKHFFKITDKAKLDTMIIVMQTTSAYNNNEEVMLYRKSSFELRKRLLPNSILDDVKRLLISGDGSINQLSFAGLVLSKDYSGISDIEYLIDHVDISYQYSSTTFLDKRNKRKPLKEISFFAPLFTNTTYPLDYSLKEQPDLGLPLITCIDDKANYENFKSLVEEQDFLHLSSHANANSTLGSEPSIKLIDSVLFLKGIDELNLNPDVIVLSACETIHGNEFVGEGINSISRAFYSQGVNTLVSTLWSVNESSSAELVQLFYKELGQKHAFDFSISEAQRNYLLTAPDHKRAPYYWAGYVVVGNLEPIQFSITPHWQGILLISTCLLIAIIFAKRLF